MTERTFADEIGGAGVVGATPRSFHVSAVHKSLGGPGGFLQITLALYLFVHIAAIVLTSMTASLIQRWQAGDFYDESIFYNEAAFIEDAGMAIFWSSIGIMVLCIIAYCVFIYSAVRNIERSNARGMTHSAWGAVGWSFVPVINLFKIYQIMGEVWQGSGDPVRGVFSRPAFMPLWWGSYVAGNVISRFAQRQMDATDDFDQLMQLSWVDAGASVLNILSAVMLLIMVRGIIAAQKGWSTLPAAQTTSAT
jgi:hypothetical protein